MSAASPIAGGARSTAAEAASAHRAARPVREAEQLRDGTPVRVRPLVAQDRALLLAGFGALSHRSRRARFLQGVSDAQFTRMLPVLLDTVDQRAHVALVLCVDGRPIGVGRLRRFASDAGVADLAVTVADEWQGHGAGSVLARELLARAGDLREIQTVVSADNVASLRMLARLGELRSDCADGDCDVVVRVGRSPAVAYADAA
jgi:RimJ/RimL family protein N-acetyltransferase